jgi:hypothetical protein
MPSVNLSELVYLVGDEQEKWPMLKDSSNFFLNKFSTMNYITVGLQNFPYPDFLINSKIVSNWHMVVLDTSETRVDNSENISKIQTIEKLSREYTDYEGEDRQIYFGTQQFIDYDTTKLRRLTETTMRDDFVNLLNGLESLEVARIDCSGQERWVLSAILDAGFLPSILNVRLRDPSKCQLTRNTIGHLRMLGYAVLYVHEDKYLFYFTNNSSYDLFDVRETGTQNPLIKKCIKTTVEAFRTMEELREKETAATATATGLSVQLKKFYTE